MNEGFRIEFPKIPEAEMRQAVEGFISLAAKHSPKDPESWLKMLQNNAAKTVVVLQTTLEGLSRARKEITDEFTKQRFTWTPESD